jgi:ubiquinone/menaquinone biosynthesis C-methylase UbiE
MDRFLPPVATTALDLGCGPGLYAEALACKGWTVHAIDRTPPPSIPGVQAINHDLENRLPFPDRQFDLVLAWDILEHLENETQMWREIDRVMKPGGILLGSVPHSMDDRLRVHNLTYKHHVDKTHRRQYAPTELDQRLQTAGLTRLAIDLKGPVSPKIFVEFISFKSLRPVAGLCIGALRRLGLLSFGELYGDIFFAARKESRTP